MNFHLLSKKISKNIDFGIFILIIASNMLFGGNGITKDQYIPFFSWDLFSSIDPSRQEIYLTLPEYNNIELTKLLSDDEAVKVRYALAQCFSDRGNPGGVSCTEVIQRILKKQEVAYANVMISEQMYPYLLRYNSTTSISERKRKSSLLSILYVK